MGSWWRKRSEQRSSGEVVTTSLTLGLMPDLGDVDINQRVAILRSRYDRNVRDLGPGHSETFILGLNLMRCMEVAPTHPECLAVPNTVLGNFKRTIGPKHPATHRATRVLADALDVQNRTAEAEKVTASRSGVPSSCSSWATTG